MKSGGGATLSARCSPSRRARHIPSALRWSRERAQIDSTRWVQPSARSNTAYLGGPSRFYTLTDEFAETIGEIRAWRVGRMHRSGVDRLERSDRNRRSSAATFVEMFAGAIFPRPKVAISSVLVSIRLPSISQNRRGGDIRGIQFASYAQRAFFRWW